MISEMRARPSKISEANTNQTKVNLSKGEAGKERYGWRLEYHSQCNSK
jgi:hypothetical protein